MSLKISLSEKSLQFPSCSIKIMTAVSLHWSFWKSHSVQKIVVKEEGQNNLRGFSLCPYIHLIAGQIDEWVSACSFFPPTSIYNIYYSGEVLACPSSSCALVQYLSSPLISQTIIWYDPHTNWSYLSLFPHHSNFYVCVHNSFFICPLDGKRSWVNEKENYTHLCILCTVTLFSLRDVLGHLFLGCSVVSKTLIHCAWQACNHLSLLRPLAGPFSSGQRTSVWLTFCSNCAPQINRTLRAQFQASIYTANSLLVMNEENGAHCEWVVGTILSTFRYFLTSNVYQI
jgi:hypothetical protein